MQLSDATRRSMQRNIEMIFLPIYSIILVKTFLDTTMFFDPFPQVTNVILYILLEVLILLTAVRAVMVDKPGKTELFFMLYLVVAFFGSVYFSEDGRLVFVLMLILGAREIPFRKLLVLYCVIAGALIVITMIVSQTGLIENLIYVSGRGPRISYGFIYPTDFTAHLFFWALAYAYLRKDHLSNPELAGILFLSVFSYAFCSARTNAICIFLLFAVLLVRKLSLKHPEWRETKLNHTMQKILPFSMPICAACFWGLTIFYYYFPNNSLAKLLDRIVSGRLQLGSMGLHCYGIKLFGMYFNMIGLGCRAPIPKNIELLDQALVALLLRISILLFLAVAATFVICAVRRKKNEKILLWILAFAGIFLAITYIFLQAAYSPLIEPDKSTAAFLIDFSKYNMLDSSYVLLLLRNGLLLFLAVIFLFVLSCLRAKKQQDTLLLWILALVAFQCMIEHHLAEIAYNPFLLLILAKTGSGNILDKVSSKDQSVKCLKSSYAKRGKSEPLARSNRANGARIRNHSTH